MPEPARQIMLEDAIDDEVEDTEESTLDTNDETTEEDLDPADIDAISQVVVTATDWTTETILSQLTKGSIDLSPSFQRRDAWTRAHKSRFIESLFLGLPIPQLVLAEEKKRRGHFIVIDGKQRLLSLRQFAAQPNDPGGFVPLRLTNLEIKRDISTLTLNDIEERPDLRNDLIAFQNQAIRTVVVKNWPSEQFLYLLFLRLNTGSIKLSPQELRQALKPGKFVQFADLFSSESSSLKRLLGRTKPDFRMRDVEILIRYFAFRNIIEEYTGNLRSFLDMACERFNKRWESEEALIREQAEAFEYALSVTFSIFGEAAFRKWNGDVFERRRNRAIVDIMAFYFSDPKVAEAALLRKDTVVEAFKTICMEDQGFRRSLETTTKSVGATFVRLNVWGEWLAECLPVVIPRLELVGDRICRR